MRALALLALATFAAGAGPAPETYKVVSVRLPVFYWEPLAARWTPVRLGEEVPGGVLFQVAQGGKVRLASPALARASGVRAGTGELSINEPMIFRLAASSFRKIELSQEVLASLPSDTKPDRQALAEGSLYADMIEGWRRDAALMFRTGKDGASGVAGPMEEPGVSIAAKAKEIRVFYPGANAVVAAPSVPARVLLVWDTPAHGKAMKFDIYVWPQGVPRPTASLTATGTSAEVLVSTPGLNFVQIVSVDGSYQSKPRMIDIALPLAAAPGLAGGRGKGAAAQGLGRFAALRPVDHTRLVGFGGQTVLSLKWSFVGRRPGLVSFVVVVQGGGKNNGAEVARLATTGETVDLALPPGAYQWTVEARWAAKAGAKDERLALSKPRSLEIGATPAGDLAGEVRRLLARKRPGHLYVEALPAPKGGKSATPRAKAVR